MSSRVYSVDSTLEEIEVDPIGGAFVKLVKAVVQYFALQKGVPEELSAIHFEQISKKKSLLEISDNSRGVLSSEKIEKLVEAMNEGV